MKEQKKLTLALASLAFVSMSMGAVTPALAEISAAFPDAGETTMAMLNTLPVLASFPATLITGQIAGRKVRYRTMLLLGLALLLGGGLLPTVLPALYQILLMRVLFGFGLGILSPLASGLTLQLMQEGPAKRQLSLNAAASNFGSVLFQMLGGVLCGLNWRATFFAYLLMFVPLIAVLTCFREPEQPRTETPARRQKTEGRFPVGTFLKWALLYGCFMMGFYAFVNNISNVIVRGGYGTTATTAVVLSLFNVAGMLGGAAFKRTADRIGRFVFLAALALAFAGYGCILRGSGLTAVIVGGMVFGLGFGMFSPAIMFYGGTCAGQENRVRVVSYLAIANNIGGFSSVYVIRFLTSQLGIGGDRPQFAAAMGIFTVLAVVSLIDTLCTRRSGKECRSA